MNGIQIERKTKRKGKERRGEMYQGRQEIEWNETVDTAVSARISSTSGMERAI